MIPRALVAADPARLPAEAVDVLVVGSGVAGMSLALRLPPHWSVLLATKDRLGQSTTCHAQGGIAAVFGEPAFGEPEPDSVAAHARDTLVAAAGLADPDAVEILVAEAAEAVGWLLHAGARFDRQEHPGDGQLREGDGLARTREGGHSRSRIIHAGGDATGAEVVRALTGALLAAGNVRVAEGAFLADLFTDGFTDGPGGGRVTGALLAGAGGPRVVRARAVVLASGGAGQLYAATTNPAGATGDGIAAALRAGADLADMEFVQFHPTALHLTAASGLEGEGEGRRMLISEALRGEGAVLLDPLGERADERRNAVHGRTSAECAGEPRGAVHGSPPEAEAKGEAKGEDGRRFMRGVHPLAELAPRDVVTRAMAARMAASGTDHLLLDATGLGPERLAWRFPTILRACRAAGIDPAREPIPIAPAAHYLMGGIRTGLDGRSSLAGLYAVGEAACTGVHGANRLASNSLLEGLVYGARAARALSGGLPPFGPMSPLDPGPRQRARAWPLPPGTPGPDMRAPLGQQRRERLRQAMTRDAGVLRTPEGLARAGTVAAALATAADHAIDGDLGAIFDLETANLAQLALALTELARRRTESRGAHWRADHPGTDPAWQLRQLVWRGPDGGLGTASVPLTARDGGGRAAAIPASRRSA